MQPRLSLVATGIAVLVGAAVWHLSGTPPAPTPPARSVATETRDADEIRDSENHVDSPGVEELADPAPGRMESWEILALDRNGRPLQGAVVVLDDAEGTPVESGPDGRMRVAFHAGTTPFDAKYDGLVSRVQTLSGHRAVVRFDDTLPLDVEVVDARDGAPVPGCRVALRRPDVGSAPVPLTTDGTRHRLEGGAVAVPGGAFAQDFDVVMPDGFALPGDFHPCRTGTVVSGRATRGRLTIPVWPAGRLSVRVVDASGAPVGGAAEVSVFDTSGVLRRRQVVLDSGGQVTLEGIAVVPETTLAVWITAGGVEKTSNALTLHAGTTTYEFDVALPAPSGPTRSGRCGGACFISADGYLPRLPGTATLEFRVLRHDGTPAPRARVCVSGWQWGPDRMSFGTPVDSQWRQFVRSDANGFVVLEGLPTDSPPGEGRGHFGMVSVALLDSGLVPTAGTFEVAAGKRTSGDLREDAGHSIELTVVDSDGDPVPWAHVAARRRDDRIDWTWASLDGDVQDLCPQTGMDGRYTIRGLPAGAIEVDVESPAGSAQFTVEAGQPVWLTLVR